MILRIMLLIFFFSTQYSVAITVDDHFNSVKYPAFHYLASDKPFAEIEQLNTTAWHYTEHGHLNLGTNQAATWLTFNLENTSKSAQTLYLVVEFPRIDELSLFYRTAQGVSESTIGDIFPLSTRKVKDSDLLFELSLAPGQNKQVYLRANTQGLMKLPISVWQPHKYMQAKNKRTLIQGLILGALLALVFIKLVLFGLTRKSQFLLASSYSFLLWLILATILGYIYRYISDEITWLSQMLIPISLMAINLIILPLSSRFLNLAKEPKQKTIITRALITLSSVMLIALPFTHYVTALSISTIASLINLIWLCGLCCHSIYKKQQHAKVLLLAQGIVLSATIFNLMVFGGSKIGIAALPNFYIATFMCSALAYFYLVIEQYVQHRDIKVSQQQKLLAEANVKDQMQVEAIKIHEQYQEELEGKVQEHTFELEVALRELQEKNRELEELNTQDALTGLRNRRYFDKKITMEFRRSRREQSPLAVAMIDIDHFKKINDQHGHLCGDEAIKHVAASIKALLRRPSDVACRYGGEEFALILPNTDINGALSVAQTIREKLAAHPIHTSAGEIPITISGGVFSSVADQSLDPNQYTDFADKALYQAKEAGRNQICSANQLIINQESSCHNQA